MLMVVCREQYCRGIYFDNLCVHCKIAATILTTNNSIAT